MGTHSAETTLAKQFYLPSENGSILKGKILIRANSFLLEQLGGRILSLYNWPFSEVDWCVEKEATSYFPSTIWWKIYRVYPIPLKMDVRK